MTLHAVWHFTAKMMKRCSCIFSLMSIMLFRNTQRHIILFSLKKAMTSDESIKSHSNVAETILHLQSCSKLVCSLGWSSLCQILLSISILFAVFWSDKMRWLKKLLLFTRVWYMACIRVLLSYGLVELFHTYSMLQLSKAMCSILLPAARKRNDLSASVPSCQSINSTFKATLQLERKYTCCVMRYSCRSAEPKLGNVKLFCNWL